MLRFTVNAEITNKSTQSCCFFSLCWSLLEIVKNEERQKERISGEVLHLYVASGVASDIKVIYMLCCHRYV